MMKTKIFLILIVIFAQSCTSAQDRGYRICTQNLFRLGEKHSFDSPQFQKQVDYLAKRISKANCSVVALQEVVGRDSTKSQKILNLLVKAISSLNHKTFEIVLGESNDRYIRNAFFVSKSEFSIERSENWNHNTLPKLDIRSSPWSYSRGPLAITIKPVDRAVGFEFLIVNDHLKSKSRGWKDKTGTSFEIARVLSAAAIKEKISRMKKDELIEVFLGDRNTNESGASAQILSGRVSITDFSRNGGCEISKEGSALCPASQYKLPDMTPLIESANKTKRVPLATYRHGSKKQILDEIYVFNEDQKYFTDSVGRIKAGTEGEFRKGSDHLLAWVEFVLQ